MKAIMLAAGEGTRSHPFTWLYPKIIQQVSGIPLLEYMLSWFGGTTEIEKLYVVVRDDSTAETLKEYTQKRGPYLTKVVDLFTRLGFKIDYVNRDLEIEIIRANGWGTGGDLRFAIERITSVDELGEAFLVCNADYVITRKLPNGEISPQLNLSDIIEYHKKCKDALNTVMTVALVMVETEAAARFGVARLEEAGGFNIVRGFTEKPRIQDILENPPVNAGVYVIDRDFIFSNIDELLPDKPSTNLEKTLLERLTIEKQPRLAAYLLDLCSWFDVGTLEQLIDVNVYIASRKGV
jgi:NDP-sugar pyrophosphorylase family protein